LWFESTEYKELICVMLAYLTGKESTQAAFAAALAGYDTSTYSESMQMLFAYADINNHRASVFTAFANELEAGYQAVVDDPGYSCGCVGGGICDPGQFNLIGLDGTVVTKIDDTHYHVVQTTYSDSPPDKRRYLAKVRDAGWQCFTLVGPGGGWAGYDSYLCDGTHVTGVGGGTGTGIQFGMVTLEYDWDPEVGIDVIFEIACPA
jgi:hypothetical protein